MIGLAEVAAGGLVGAPARFALDQWVTAKVRGPFPLGTFVVNASGALLLGVVSGLAMFHGLGPLPVAALGSGFCGAYTTFSTFSYEMVRLVEDGHTAAAIGNLVGSLLTGLLGAGLGLAVTAAV